MGNPAGMLLFSLVILAAIVMVWGAMMIRKMLLIVAAVMTPLAFAGGAADITRSWVRRWIEFTAALIASKLLLVIILMVGLSVFEGAGLQQGGGGSQTVTQLATGSVLLLLAGLAPFIAVKMFHFAGDSLHAVHAQANAARAGTEAMVAAPRKVIGMASQGRLLGMHLSGPPGAGAAGARGPSIEPSNGSSPQTPRPAGDDRGTPAGSGRTSAATEPSQRPGAHAAESPTQKFEPRQATVPANPQR